MTYLFTLIFSAVLSALMVHLFRRIAFRLEIGSFPSPRKIHKEFVPLLGGVGFGVAWILTLTILALIGWTPASVFIGKPLFWAGLGIILLTGLLDDIIGLSSWQKFLGQILAATAAVFGGCVIDAFVAPGGSVLKLQLLSYPFTILWFVFIMNALNLLDGLDGLAGGVSLIAVATFTVIAWSSHQLWLLVLGISIMGALLGFLKYNFHPAKVFMGDAGSLQLGYLLAFFSVETMRVASSNQIFFLASMVILGVPITDTLISFFRRLSRGQHPFLADQEHIHHRLMKLGLTHPQTVILMYLFGFFYGFLGVLMTVYQEFIGLVLFLFALSFALFLSWRLGYLESRQMVRIGLRNMEGIDATQPMLHWNRLLHQILIFIGDIFSINLALYLTYWFKFQSGFISPITVHSFQEYLSNPVFVVFTLGWLILFWLNGLYQMPWDVSRFDKITRVSKIITFGVFVLGLSLLDFSQAFSGSQLTVLGFYWIVMLFLVNGVRLIIIEIEKRYHLLEYSFKTTLIVGANRKAKNLIRDIRKNPHLLYRVVGIVDKKNDIAKFEGIPMLGTYQQLPRLIKENKVEEVVVTLGEREKETLLKIIAQCDQTGVIIKTLPDLQKFMAGRNPELAGHSLVKIFPENMVMWQWMVKRLIDLLFALGNLILLFPIWAVLGSLIKLKFKSGVLVRIPALGKNGTLFQMLLFRMSPEPHDSQKKSIYVGSGLTGSLPPLGEFLFQTRLYKLPLIINILKGDMSLVGPRPEPVEWYHNNYQKLRFLHRRLMVRPGFTGLAQVKYRFETSQQKLQERINSDIFYIENMSIGLDIRIIVRSVLLFFKKPANNIATTP